MIGENKCKEDFAYRKMQQNNTFTYEMLTSEICTAKIHLIVIKSMIQEKMIVNNQLISSYERTRAV
jgi:hypothetical protein